MASSTTFTTSASTTQLPSFRLVSSNPASGDVGVPVDSPVTMTFTNPVDPATVSFTNIEFFTSFPVSGVFSTSGNTVTFTPTTRWPSATSILVFLNALSRASLFLQDLRDKT